MVFKKNRKRKKRKPRIRKDVMRRGVYILPSAITTLGLFFGFASIIRSINGFFEEAAIAIVIAGIFDFLDGYVARLTKSTSDFGVQYDSLADLVSFGLAPGILAYTWALQPFGRIGWLATFLYFACAALRLARFNVQSEDIEKNFFQGLPTPAAGGIIASWVLFHYFLTEKYNLEEEIKSLSVVLVVYALAFLMVSTFRYRNLKHLSVRERLPFHYLVMGVLVLIIVASKPAVFLFPLAILFAAHGPFESLIFFPRRKKERREQQNASETETSSEQVIQFKGVKNDEK